MSDFDNNGYDPSEVNLLFQRYAHDKRLGGASPTVDGGPVNKAKTQVLLSPAVYHNETTDKTIEAELERGLRNLAELLK